MKNYPTAFEKYWNRHATVIGQEAWLNARIKHACYLAWMQGRRQALKNIREAREEK